MKAKKKLADKRDILSKIPEPYLLIGLFLLALVLRMIYLAEIRDNPFFENLILDPLAYDTWAQQISKGDWIGSKIFYQSPLYPYFLAIIYRIFGHNLFAVRVIQFIIGSLNCILIYLIGKKAFNPRVGLLAALMAVFYKVFFFYEGEINKTFLSVFLIDLTLLTLIVAEEKALNRFWVLSGIFFGFTILVRGNYLLVLPFVLLWLFVVSWENQKKQAIKNFLYLLLGTAIIISPVTLRNYLVGDDFVLTTSQGGQNFFIGNNPFNLTGGYMSTDLGRGDPKFEEKDFRRKAEDIVGRKLKPSEVSNFWFGQAMKFIRSQPGAYLSLLGRKFLLFWNKVEVSDNQDVRHFARFSLLLRSPLLIFGIIAPLGLLGIGLALRRKGAVLLLNLFTLAYCGSVVSFFIFSRYRLPVVTPLLIFAAYAILWWIEKLKQGRFRPIIISLLPLSALTLFVNANLNSSDSSVYHDSWFHQNLGLTYFRNAEYQKAAEEFKKVIEIMENYNLAYSNSDISRKEQGYDEDSKAFQMDLRLDPAGTNARMNWLHADAYIELGLLSEQQEDYPQAITYYQKAIALSPENFVGHYNLGVVYRKLRYVNRAITEFKKASELNPDFIPAYMNLARCYKYQGDKDQAIRMYQKVLEIDPGFTLAKKELSLFFSD
ncbi:MAG: tetratricopeptide repeat protein [Deltaproteobacteria bacterium]|nr:MAG: tetratricopeptide repeat protein [Deltaproteobacteria bacterium]